MIVKVDGTTRRHGDSDDGWHLESDNRTVVLLGTVCDEARTGKAWEITLLCVHPILNGQAPYRSIIPYA